jgi:16S rRNA (guanine527-N7)-methyltransferase
VVAPSPSFPLDQARRILDAGLEAMALEPVSADRRSLLLDYLGQLAQWNRVHNLTAVRDPLEMVSHHLLDSLSLLPCLPEGEVCDIGSGAGLPGLPLAICRPDQTFTLVEPTGKRAAFLRSVVAGLGLSRVRIIQSRSEAYRPAAYPAAVVSRAVASLAELDLMTQHLQGPATLCLALKGPRAADEIAAWPRAAELQVTVQSLQVPGLPPRVLVGWQA